VAALSSVAEEGPNPVGDLRGTRSEPHEVTVGVDDHQRRTASTIWLSHRARSAAWQTSTLTWSPSEMCRPRTDRVSKSWRFVVNATVILGLAAAPKNRPSTSSKTIDIRRFFRNGELDGYAVPIEAHGIGDLGRPASIRGVSRSVPAAPGAGRRSDGAYRSICTPTLGHSRAPQAPIWVGWDGPHVVAFVPVFCAGRRAP